MPNTPFKIYLNLMINGLEISASVVHPDETNFKGSNILNKS